MGPGPVPAIILRRRGADSVAFTSTFFPNWIEVAKVDPSGHINGIDASATTVKVRAERVQNLAFDNVVSQWAAYEAAHGGAIGQIADVADRRFHDVTVPEVPGNGLCLGRGLDDDETTFGHAMPISGWMTGSSPAVSRVRGSP